MFLPHEAIKLVAALVYNKQNNSTMGQRDHEKSVGDNFRRKSPARLSFHNNYNSAHPQPDRNLIAVSVITTDFQ